MSTVAASRILRVAGLLTVLALAWWVAAPVAIGGQSAFVTVVGSSMEPTLRTGDLVVLRAADGYAVGDVVGYRSDELDRVVLHRIVAEENGRFRLQGDNNDWLDPDHPGPDDVVGRQLLHVPQGGVVLDHTTRPWVLGLVVLGLVLSGGHHVRRSHRKRRGRTPMTELTGTPAPRPASGRRTLVTATAASFLLSAGATAALGAASLTHDSTSAASGGSDEDSRSLSFAYRTEVSRSPAYDRTTVVSPQPVFRAVADTVDVEYDYSGPAGTLDLVVELSTTGGWRSEVTLGPPVPVAETAQGTVVLDLDELDSRARRASAVTGLSATELGVTVVAEVTSAGATSFVAELPLTMSAQRLALVGDVEGRGSGTVTVREEPSASAGSATEPVVLGRTVERGALHRALAVAAALSVGSAALLHVLLRRRLAAGDDALIRRRYSGLLIEVEPVTPPSGRPVIDVTDFRTLARLAERYGLLVLHWSRSGVHTYTVQDDSATYRYRTSAGAPPVASERPEPEPEHASA